MRRGRFFSIFIVFVLVLISFLFASFTFSGSEDENVFKELHQKFWSASREKGIDNVRAEDVLNQLSPETLGILKKFYFDNGCPLPAKTFEECVQKFIDEYKKLVKSNKAILDYYMQFQVGDVKEKWVCPVNPDIKDKDLCYDEVKRQLVLLPILALLGDKELKSKNWVMTPRIFPKEVPSTALLAVEGVACGITSGNLPDTQPFATNFINNAFSKGVPYSIQNWVGGNLTSRVNTPYPCPEPDCGVQQNLNTAQGEFFGLLQWLADELEKNLTKADIVKMVQGLLCGQGTCSSMAGVTLCLVVKDNSSSADPGYRCYGDTGSPSPSNDYAVFYYNRAVVEVLPDPVNGYITAIIALWAENAPFPLPGGGSYTLAGHNTIDGGNPYPTSEACVEARTCADGWTFAHSNRGARVYTEGILLRVRLQPVVQGSLVDVCAISSDLDILGSDADVAAIGCIADCADTESLLESSLGGPIASAFNSFLHGNCPIPGVPGRTDADFSLCPQLPKGLPGSGPGGSNCSALLPACPTYSSTWNCCWNYTTSSMQCQCPELGGGGGGGCKHAMFPIDLNEVAALGSRSFSVAQYCGRPTTVEDPDTSHAHNDPQKCYAGPINTSFLVRPKQPWYGTMGCGQGIYDVGCYTNPSRMILTGTGCSISFDVGIRPKDLSGSCAQFGPSATAQAYYTFTSGFFPRPAFGRDNYAPFPLPNNALYWSWLSGVPLTALGLTGGNVDNGYAQTGIGFTFNFYNGLGGGSYTDICVQTNGYIGVPQGNTGCATTTSSISEVPDPIPSTSAPNGYIAPLWADLSGDNNEFLYYKVELPPLFLPRARQARPPGSWAPAGDTRPNTVIGWTGSSVYYHLLFNNYETNICNNTTDFNNYVYAYPLPAGFNFPFYNQLNNLICIDSNGVIYPRTTTAGCPGSTPSGAPIPNPGGPNGLIAALWKDLDPAHIVTGDNGGADCDGRCPECEDGCIGACTTTGDSRSWFCHQPGDQTCNPGWTYCGGNCTNCGANRWWCANWDTTNSDVCCGTGDCEGTCNSNGVCSGTCYSVPGCVPSACRIGPCSGDQCGCNDQDSHCHGTCILGVCTSCDVKCDSTGGAGGCNAQNQCCFWRNGGWECACASTQTCQGGCEADANFLDPEPQQRQFRVMGMGYVQVGSIDYNMDGVPDSVDCPGADLANGVFDDNNNGIYYEDDDPSAPNCQALVITWYRIPDFDAINDTGCGNDDNNDCPGTGEDCCSGYICSGGACQNCGPCNSDNRELCRLRAAGIISPDPNYGTRSGEGNCLNRNTFQVVLFSDGTIDINLEQWANTNILIDVDGPGGSGCSNCGCPFGCCLDCDCDPKTNPRPHYVGIEDYSGIYGIGVANPRTFITYRFIRVGPAGTVCGSSQLLTASRTDCPDTLQPGVAPPRTCRIVKWDNYHVKGQAICIDMYGILYNVGTGFNPANNYDIVFFYENFKSPLPGITNPQDQARAARTASFPRTIGVENGNGTLGQYGFLPPDGTGVVMRYLPQFTYWIGMGISQDAWSDIAHMFYSSGWMCLAVNPGGVVSADASKFTDIGVLLPIGSFSDVENLQYFFPAVRYLCDPDGKAEIRFIPQGNEGASARTGTAWPSLLTPDAPGSASLSGTPDAFPSSFQPQKFADVTFLLPNYRVDFWCKQNNISQFVKDGVVGPSNVLLFQGYGNWFLGLDLDWRLSDTSTGFLDNSPFRVTNVTMIFIDVKPQISNIVWNVSVPVVGRIGGLADILGDILSGYLQGILRTRWNLPLSPTDILHIWIKYVSPEGPDVTVDEFPNTSSWQAIETKYPWVVTMPDYLAIYIGCVGPDPINDCRNRSISGNLDLAFLLNAFGGGFLAPPSLANGNGKVPLAKPEISVVLPNGKICSPDKPCYISYEEAKQIFGDEEGARLQVIYSGLTKLSWRKRYSGWKIPYVLPRTSGSIYIRTGPFIDGENELSFLVVDEKNFLWEDVMKISFVLDRVPPSIKILGGEFDDRMQAYIFHREGNQVVSLEVEDNVSSKSNIEVSWSIDGGEWSEWQKGVRTINLSLPKGVYKLHIRARDEAKNEEEISHIIYVKGDEVMGCPVIGSVNQKDVSKMLATLNALIPVSVALFAVYILKFIRNGNGNGKKEEDQDKKEREK